MEQLQTLRKLGMTEYESRAYLSLARLGPSTVREIVMESKLPRNKAYEALQRLEQKHKVMILPVSPRKYAITDPDSLKQDVDDLSKSVFDLVKLIEQPKTPEFKDLFWIIKGQKAIQEKLALQDAKVKKEVLTCNKLSRILPRNIQNMKGAIARGVKVKMICEFKEENRRIYDIWVEMGAELRVFNKEKFGPLLPRISIFDGTTARLTIGQPEVKNKEDYITIWTESKAFSRMLRTHFITMWKECEPIENHIGKK